MSAKTKPVQDFNETDTRFITDREIIAAAVAFDDVGLAIALGDIPNMMTFIGTPWRLYVVARGDVAMLDCRRAFMWVDWVPHLIAITGSPWRVCFDRRVYLSGFFTVQSHGAAND